MNNFLNKIFGYKKKLGLRERSFLEIINTTKINNVFEAISKFNETSEIRYVGGCVRKILNGESFDDIDLATNISPEQVKECLNINNIKFFETGIDHGTITANIENKNFEITSLRKDISTDGRHAVVKFTNDWNEDSSRRDFTINAIYADKEGNLFDPHNGVKDLQNGLVNFIGDPEKRIKEDYLRILRYISFFLNYSKGSHQPEIKKVIKKNISGIKNLSKERILDELKKIIISSGFYKLSTDDFSKEIILIIFPQIKNLDIFKKLSNYSKNIIQKKDFIFLLSLLIIDETDNSNFFLYKFNFSNENKKRINFLKEIFGKPLEDNVFSKKNLQKIFYFYEKSYLIDMIDFQLIKLNKENKKLISLKKYFEKISKPSFPIKANKLMEKYNLKEGRVFGQKLKKIEKLWMDNNFKITDKDVDKIFLD